MAKTARLARFFLFTGTHLHVTGTQRGGLIADCRLLIDDCRLTIEKVVRQLLPMSVSNRRSTIDIRQSAIPAILGRAMLVENLRRTRRR